MRLLVVHGEGLGNIIEILPLLRTLDNAGITADLFLVNDDSRFSRDFLNDRKIYLSGDKVDASKYDGKIETVWGNFNGRSASLAGIKTLNDLARQTMRLDKSEVDVYLNAARDIGIDESSFVFDCKDELKTEKPVNSYDVVLANGYNWKAVANRWDLKSYPAYPDLVKRIIDNGMSVCSVGASHEYIEGTVDETGKSLAQTCGLLKAAKVVVSTDSGIYHCSCSLGVPTVVLFTFTNVCKNYDKRFHASAAAIWTEVPCRLDCHAKMNWMKCEKPKCQDIPLSFVEDTMIRRINNV